MVFQLLKHFRRFPLYNQSTFRFIMLRKDIIILAMSNLSKNIRFHTPIRSYGTQFDPFRPIASMTQLRRQSQGHVRLSMEVFARRIQSHYQNIVRNQQQKPKNLSPSSLPSYPSFGFSSIASEPTKKRPRDSYVEDFVRFHSDETVREEYINMYGSIRVGKILEDLDALAASIGYLHVLSPDTPPSFLEHIGHSQLTSSSTQDTNNLNREQEERTQLSVPTIVTASVDRLDLLKVIPNDQDLMMSGHVTYVGTSSIEISVTLETCVEPPPPEGQEQMGYDASFARKRGKPILTAKFIMVALDSDTGKPTPVTQLRLDTEEDRLNFERGAQNKLRKRIADEMSLTKKPPVVEEMYLVHGLYQKSQQLRVLSLQSESQPEVTWMKDTRLQSLTICMPQDRNIHNKIFGGYLMRLAFELAFTNALIFCKSKIRFVAMDDIQFREPINIGSLLNLESQIVYSPGAPSKSFQVSVQADVIDYRTGSRRTTNTFHFTFNSLELDHVPPVMPESYEESMKYLEGKRRKERWLQVTEGLSPWSQ